VSQNTDNLSEIPGGHCWPAGDERTIQGALEREQHVGRSTYPERASKALIRLWSSGLQLTVELKIFFTERRRDFARIFFLRRPDQALKSRWDSRAPNPLPTKLMKNKRFHCAVKTLSEADFAPPIDAQSQAAKAVERLQNLADISLNLIIPEALRFCNRPVCSQRKTRPLGRVQNRQI
jgi:hypothetical protein